MNQDNQSTMKLENNGNMSSGKRTRHINIRYFFITDNIKNGNIVIQYCPTLDMIADFYTKPLQGKLFYKFRDQIMGLVPMDTIETPEDHRIVLDIKSNCEVCENMDRVISTENNLNIKNTAEEDKTVTWAEVVKGKQVCVRS